MPIRIYALAKKLNIDSKLLVEQCAKAGVTGKGSALASLTDEELAKVQEYLAKSKTPTASTTSSVPGMGQRTMATAEERTFTRDDYIGPSAVSGKPPVIESKPARVEARKTTDERSRPPVSREPVVKLAAIPQAPVPVAPAEPDEPAPQKPIMTLPKEAIRGAMEASSAPLKQFTKQHDRKRKDKDKEKEKVRGEAEFEPAVDEVEVDDSVAKRGAKKLRKTKEVQEDGEDRANLAGMASARATRQTARRRPPGAREEAGVSVVRQPRQVRRSSHAPTAPRMGSVVVKFPCTIRAFSETTGIPATTILRALMGYGVSVSNINSELEQDYAEMLAAEAGVQIESKQAATLEDTLISSLEAAPDDPVELVPRPPVVTFLGHVDHGKTSLLDRILGLNVVSGEAGGITQHIRAYSVEKDGRIISFVDTPGHEAFTEMRARGANVTDIAVLVVAADDGIMPQTEEAISHAKAAGVPIVVAMNKIDLPAADENKVYQGLSAHELLPTEWGGDVEVVKTSAVTGKGVDELLETLLLTAELHEYKANPRRAAIGTCLEAQQEGGRGVVAKLIVQRGTLHVGDIIVCGAAHGRVKAMYDTLNTQKKVPQAGPSIPVNVTGLDIAPEAGDRFYVLDDIQDARQIAEQRSHRARTQTLSGRSTKMSFEEFQRRLEEGLLGSDEEVATLKIILRADVRGSIEAIQKELSKLDHPEVRIQILQASVGGITVADVTLADASDAVIVGFNVIPDETARALADERGVEIRRYSIIYKVSEDIKSMLEGKLRPEEQVKDLGRALVQRTFVISRLGTIAGCRVLAGTIERGCRIRVNRDGRGIGDYPLDSLKREKDDAKEVREGMECGMKLAGFNDLKEGDVLEAYKIEEIARTL